MNYQIDKKQKQTNRLISHLLQSYFVFNYFFKLNLACFVLSFVFLAEWCCVVNRWPIGITLFSLYLHFIHFILSYPIQVLAFLWTLYCIIYFCVSHQSPSISEGPLISCSWLHDALFVVRKALPEGYLFQASGVTKGRKITSWNMWKERKIFH